MGMNIHVRSPKAEIDKLYERQSKTTYLNRFYTGFINSEEIGYENGEYTQIENLYQIDLSPLKMFNYGGLDLYQVELEEDKEWELSKVETEEEKSEINQKYENKLLVAKQQDLEAFQNNWVQTSLVKTTILELVEKVKSKPSLLDEIDFCSLKKENFNFFKEEQSPNKYYILSDFEIILDFIAFLEKKKVNQIAFYEGY